MISFPTYIKDDKKEIDQQNDKKEDSKIERTAVQSSLLTWILFTIAVGVFAYWIFSKEYPQTINYRDHILKLSNESFSMANSVNTIIDMIPDSSLIKAKVVNMTLHLETVKTDTLNPFSYIDGNEISFYQKELS